MIITSTLLLIIVGVCVIALAIGHFTSRQEIYFLGVIFLFLTGLYTAAYGLDERVGDVTSTNQTISGGDTSYSTVSTIVYEKQSTAQNTAIGLALVILSAGLALEFYSRRGKEERRKNESIEVDDA